MSVSGIFNSASSKRWNNFDRKGIAVALIAETLSFVHGSEATERRE